MACIFRWQGNGLVNNQIAGPTANGFDDVGTGVTGSALGTLASVPRLETSSFTMSNGRVLKSLHALDSAVGGDLFYWRVFPSDKPIPTPSAVTGPWSARFYIKTQTPASAVTFLAFRTGSTTNIGYARAASPDRIIRTASGSNVSLPNATSAYRIEIQADPNRTNNLVWRVYLEDNLTPINGVSETVSSVSWDNMLFGYLNAGYWPVQFHFAQMEIHNDYNLGGKFRSDPQNGVTPASTTAVGAPSWDESPKGSYNVNPATFSTSSTVSNPFGTPQETLNISYASSPLNYNRKFDLYLPGPTPPVGGWPVVCWAHPGFFSEKDKSVLPENWKTDMLNAGYAIASIQYVKTDSTSAVAPYTSYGTGNVGGRYPSFIIDYKLAAAYMRDNAESLKINPDKMFATGYSAGGYIALAAAMTKNLETDSAGNKMTILGATLASLPWGSGYNGEDPDFIGAYVFCAPVDLDLARSWDPSHPDAGSVINRFAYRWFQGLHANGTLTSPTFPTQSITDHINLNSLSNLCPVAYERGTADYLVHWEHEAALKTALTAKGVNYSEFVTPNTHDLANSVYDIQQQLSWFNALAYPKKSETLLNLNYSDGSSAQEAHPWFKSLSTDSIVTLYISLTGDEEPPPPVYIPTLDFSDSRNSQYIPIVF
jgi:acetyl esterase/lipase